VEPPNQEGRGEDAVVQAVSWTIKSPLVARPIHITGVYVSPSVLSSSRIVDD